MSEEDFPTTDASADGVRLQKVLAQAGVASRRVSEELIADGRVRVNGVVVTEMGARIHPESDLVDVDGVAVQVESGMRYVMLNKPTGVFSTMRDERGRPDLTQYTEEWPIGHGCWTPRAARVWSS